MKPYKVATIFYCPSETGIFRLFALPFLDDRTNHPFDATFTFYGLEYKIRVVGIATRMSRADALSLAIAYTSESLSVKRIEFDIGKHSTKRKIFPESKDKMK